METDCQPLTGFARMEALRRRAVAAGIPLHVSLALTHRCNLRCIHCYVLPNAKPPDTELATGDWLALAREAAEAGCFSMLLTGGEPLLRRDFTDIYLGIRSLGIFVTLFTNATRIDARVVETLRRAPPRLVEVTVYGTTPETYERVTGFASAHAEAMRGISRLREAGLSVRLKTMVMRETFPEFAALRALAGSGEKPMRYDATVHPRFSGDAEIGTHHVPPAEVADMESRLVPELARQWRQKLATWAERPPIDRSRLYTCGAGAQSCYVSAEGLVQPCINTARYGVPYQRGGFLSAFRQGREALRARRAPPGYECAACPDRLFCNMCPALAELDSGDEAGKFAYACELAHARRRKINEH